MDDITKAFILNLIFIVVILGIGALLYFSR